MRKTANQCLAANLKRHMDEKGLSCLALSKLAGVAANTIGNYLDTEPELTNTGKERSAKRFIPTHVGNTMRWWP